MPLTVIAWLILYFGGAIQAFRRHPVWGLWTYSFALYASPGHNWWGEYMPNLRWSLMAALITFLSIFLNGKQLQAKPSWLRNGAIKILIAYTVWMWIQLPWTLSFEIHLEACILFTKYIVLFYLLYTILDNDNAIFLFILFNIIGGCFWGILIRGYSAHGRVEGIGGPGIDDSNTLGMHLCVVLIFTALMLLKKNTIFKSALKWKIIQGFMFIAGIFIANGVVQTISRSAVLGLISGGMVLFWFNTKPYRKRFYIYSFVALMGLLAMIPNTFWERLDTVQEAASGGEIEASAYSRLVIAEAQLEMFKLNVLGHGHRGTAILSPLFIPFEYLTSSTGRPEDAARSSHCTFLTTLVEQGIPGAVLYWMMVLWGIRTVCSFRKENKIVYLYVMMLAASLMVIFISGIFVDYLKVEIQVYCLAILASLKNWENKLNYQKYSGAKP